MTQGCRDDVGIVDTGEASGPAWNTFPPILALGRPGSCLLPALCFCLLLPFLLG